MEIGSVLEALRARGNANTAKTYRRHGAVGETWGVSYADLAVLTRTLRGRHDLAEPLWATGVHDARILATKIADAEALSRETIEAWLADAAERGTANAVADVAAVRADAETIAADWAGRPGEWTGTAGWSVYASLAMAGRLGDETARGLVARARVTLHGAPNMVRHHMNMALIAIGIRCPEVRDEVHAAAHAIGPVRVDHGQTGCLTPEIVPYIARAVARQAARAPKAPRPSRTRRASPALAE